MHLNENVSEIAKKIKLLILDIDGVLTDGGMYFDDKGTELKKFNSLDGHGIKMLLDSGIEVDIASIKGGKIPVDPESFFYAVKTNSDTRYLEDPILKEKVENSILIDELEIDNYDLVFISGGWGAAYDLGYSETLGEKISQAYYNPNSVIGGVCHGVLGFINAKDSLGNLIIKNKRMTGVTDKQIKELGIDFTPQHPEEELIKAGVIFESKTALRDVFANLTIVDDESKFVSGQNQNAGHETPQKMMEILKNKQWV